MGRDKATAYLVTVGPMPGQSDRIHLALAGWNPVLKEWIHGQAICGRSVAQGELPGNPVATCPDCFGRKIEFQQMLTDRSAERAARGALERVRELHRDVDGCCAHCTELHGAPVPHPCATGLVITTITDSEV